MGGTRSSRMTGVGITTLLMVPMLSSISYFQGLKAYLSWLYKLIWDLGEWGAPGGSPIMLLTVLAFASPIIGMLVGRRISAVKTVSIISLCISACTFIVCFNLPPWAEMMVSSLIVGLYGVLLPYMVELFSGLEDGPHILAVGFILAISYELSLYIFGVTYGPPFNPSLLPVQLVVSAVSAYVAVRIWSIPYSPEENSGVEVSTLKYVLAFSSLWLLLFLQFTVFSSPSFLLRLSGINPTFLGVPLLALLLIAGVSASAMIGAPGGWSVDIAGWLVIVGAILSLLYTLKPYSLILVVLGQFFIALNVYLLLRYSLSRKPGWDRVKAVSAACLMGSMLLFMWTVMYTFTFVYAFLSVAAPFRGKLPLIMVPACIVASILILSAIRGETPGWEPRVNRRLILLAAIPLLLVGVSAPMYRVNPEPTGGRGLRVMTYNIHEGFNVDGRLNMEAVAATIMKFNPDILVLQEVDQGCAMTAYLDEAVWLGKRLNMFLAYVPALEGVWQGDIILSKYPILESNYTLLPSPGETDVLLWAVLNVKGRKVTVFAVHFTAVGPEDRKIQLDRALRIVEAAEGPVIWAGDFNMDAYTDNPTDRESILRIRTILQDTFSLCPPGSRHGDNTSTSWNPHERIDYIYVSPDFTVLEHGTIKSLASDHLPVYAEITIPQ